MKLRKAAQKKPAKQRAPRKRHMSTKMQRILMLLTILSAVGLLAFVEVVRPNEDAKSYTHRLDVASQPLEKCFEDLAKTTDLKLFYAPDISYAGKSADTTAMLRQITACREEVKAFDQVAHQLLVLRFAGYTSTYREAKVNQRQAFDIVGQSNDVLDQYQGMAAFLSDYYKHIDAFKTYTGQLDTDNGYFSAARLKALSNQANDLRTRSVSVQQLAAPAEFEPTKNATSAMFAKAADGFDKLVNGYTYGNDFLVSSGYTSIDQAVADYDSNVSNLPFNQITTSYIPQQVLQLPAKVEGLLATASE